MKTAEKQPTYIRLSPRAREELARYAAEEDQTVAQLIREAVDLWLKREERRRA